MLMPRWIMTIVVNVYIVTIHTLLISGVYGVKFKSVILETERDGSQNPAALYRLFFQLKNKLINELSSAFIEKYQYNNYR